MMGTLPWIAVCLVYCIATVRRWPWLGVSTALGLWLLVPQVATPAIIQSSYHPGAWMAACACLSLAFSGTRAAGVSTATFFQRWPRYIVLVVLSAVGTAAATYAVAHLRGFSLTIQLAIFPAVWAVAALLVMWRGRMNAIRMGQAYLLFVSVNCVMALGQRLNDGPLVWEQYFATSPTYTLARDRVFGLSDGPVALAMLCAVGAPLIIVIRRAPVRYLVAVLFVVTSVLTGGRAGAIGTIIGILYVIVSRRTSAVVRICEVLVGAAAVAVIWTGSYSANLQSRIENDNGSARLKDEAWRYFLNHLSENVFLGQGAGASVQIKFTRILDSSIENGYFGYAYEYGLVICIFLIITQLIIAFSGRPRISPGVASFLISVCVAFTFSSIVVSPSLAVTVWFAAIVASSEIFRRTDSGHVVSVYVPLAEPINEIGAFDHEIPKTGARVMGGVRS